MFNNKHRSLVSLFSLLLLSFGLVACGGNATSKDNTASKSIDQTKMEAKGAEGKAGAVKGVKFEKYTLDNGLDVILHVDKSDPVVAIDLTAHVGSSREVTGRTGFAHLFEHLLFLDSENLGYGGLDEMNTRIGGEGTNGYTTNDVTKYFQAVPKDGLEKIIWAEADKIGYFVNTVTDYVVDKEKQVVKNEKRQRVDNVPYGHRWYVVDKALYPEDHPYNWQVIGSLADLEAASAADAKDFYNRWYVPNNVTVTLAGDFEIAEAKQLINKYFGEIPKGKEVAPITPRASNLKETTKLYYEDNFATVPQLTMTWPSAEQFHPDSYALNILTEYLADGKRAPLNEVLIDEDKVTSSVAMFQSSAEIAGATYLIVNAKDGADLDAFKPSLDKAFKRFEKNGISQEDLDLIIARQEVAFYEQLGSVLNKAIQLGQYNAYTNDPGFINKDIKNIQSVTREDVMRVYNKYMKDKAHVELSIVPKGQTDLIIEGSVKAEIVEEKIVAGAEKEIAAEAPPRDFEPTKSSFDRSVEPPFGSAVKIKSPKIWKDKLANGVQVLGIKNSETPLVYFSLTLDTGRKDGSIDKPAVAGLTAALLEKGTKNKTTAELEDAINALGSSLSVSSGSTQTTFSGTSLARNFEKTIAILEEMLLEPRWDTEEFGLLISKTVDDIKNAEGSPGYIRDREWPKLLYPDNHIYSFNSIGPKEKVEVITLADLQDFYKKNYVADGAKLKVAGDISNERVKKSMSSLSEKWKRTGSKLMKKLAKANKPEKSKIYFYDVPGAKQSTLKIGTPSISPIDADYTTANAMNYLLGNIYTSRLNTELRVNKGYTYGIGSRFVGTADHGQFWVRSSVRSNVTLEANQLIRDIVGNYGETFTEDDLKVMKSALIKGQALTTETLASKLSMLNTIATYGYPDDFMSKDAALVEGMTVKDVQTLADKYLTVDKMNYLIIGDAATQLDRLKELGYGDPVLLNPKK